MYHIHYLVVDNRHPKIKTFCFQNLLGLGGNTWEMKAMLTILQIATIGKQVHVSKQFKYIKWIEVEKHYICIFSHA